MSDSTTSTLAQVAETSLGVLPASPVFSLKRITKDTLNYLKETVVSGEIRADRQIPDVLLTQFSAAGGYDFELSAADFSLLFQNALFCTPTVQNIPAVSVTITASTRTIAATAGTFSGLLPMQRIRISGTTVDDGIWSVATVAVNGASFTVFETSISEPTGNVTLANYSGTASFAATIYRNNVVRNSMAIEMSPAPGFFILYTGMMVNTLRLTLEAKRIAVGTVEFMGLGAVASTSSASAGAYSGASTNPIMNCSSNVGRLWTNGQPFTTGVKMMTIEISNNLRQQPAVGQVNLFGIGLGQFRVSGSLQLYFKDIAMYNQFIAHTPTALSTVLSDSNGNGLSFTMPRIQIETAKTDVPGVNADIMLDVTYAATLDPVTGMTFQISQL